MRDPTSPLDKKAQPARKRDQPEEIGSLLDTYFRSLGDQRFSGEELIEKLNTIAAARDAGVNSPGLSDLERRANRAREDLACGLGYHVAGLALAKTSIEIEKEDMIGQANLAFVKAVQAWDPKTAEAILMEVTAEKAVLGYFKKCVDNALTRFVSENGRGERRSRAQIERFKEIEATRDLIAQERGIESFLVDNTLVAERLSQDPTRRAVTAAYVTCVCQSMANPVSLEGDPDSESGDLSLAERIPDEASLPDENVAFSDYVERMRDAMSKLPDKERELIELHCFQGTPFRQIAEILGEQLRTTKRGAGPVTDEMARQRFHSVVKKLRALMGVEVEGGFSSKKRT